MLSVLLGLHFALTLAIIGLVLLQKHDSDGALGSSGGGAASGMFSVRGQANILTKSTAILMTIFMVNCLVMAKITKNKPSKVSVIDRVANESILPVKDDPKDSSANSETASNEKPTSASSSNSNQPKASKQPAPAKPAPVKTDSKNSTKK
ncbi:MAG: preprotein translocase subunit SecG [Alphaproteobacteria bacterium]|nr:preprotein translocase subunit SecG [Alphaproteobacteria bacterium]MBO7641567.1 preprotein translocase subunit SecG [Alphaproteobacteria bacterium]